MRYLFLALLLVFNLCGCVSSKVASNKDPNFNQKLTKIYLVLKTSKYSKDFRELFQKTFLDELSKKNILCFYEVPDPLALETETDLQKRIAEAGADVVMTFTQTESSGATSYRTFNGGYAPSYSSSVFDVKMFLPNSDRPVWRANIDVGTMGDLSDGGRKTAKKLLEQMIKDGLM
jgi:hypothetical protein